MLIVGHFEFVSLIFSGCILHVKMNNSRKGGHFEFDQVKFFQDASSSEISHFVL